MLLHLVVENDFLEVVVKQFRALLGAGVHLLVHLLPCHFFAVACLLIHGLLGAHLD